MPAKPNMGGRHLSKSTSELSSPREMPEARPRSAAPPETSHLSVYQKAHSFFSQLKVRILFFIKFNYGRISITRKINNIQTINTNYLKMVPVLMRIEVL